jgi:hypothetical protein
MTSEQSRRAGQRDEMGWKVLIVIEYLEIPGVPQRKPLRNFNASCDKVFSFELQHIPIKCTYAGFPKSPSQVPNAASLPTYRRTRCNPFKYPRSEKRNAYYSASFTKSSTHSSYCISNQLFPFSSPTARTSQVPSTLTTALAIVSIAISFPTQLRAPLLNATNFSSSSRFSLSFLNSSQRSGLQSSTSSPHRAFEWPRM